MNFETLHNQIEQSIHDIDANSFFSLLREADSLGYTFDFNLVNPLDGVTYLIYLASQECNYKCRDIVRIISEIVNRDGDIHAEDNSGKTALYVALNNIDYESTPFDILLVETLLRVGADPNQELFININPDYITETNALMFSVFNNLPRNVLGLLVNYGATLGDYTTGYDEFLLYKDEIDFVNTLIQEHRRKLTRSSRKRYISTNTRPLRTKQ